MARKEERRVAYRDLLGRREGRRPFGTRTFRWDDNIKTDIEGIAWKGVDWIHLAEDKEQWWTDVNTATKPWVIWLWDIHDATVRVA